MRKATMAIALSSLLVLVGATPALAVKIENEGRVAQKNVKVRPASVGATVQFVLEAGLFNQDQGAVARCRVWVHLVRGYAYTTPEGYGRTRTPQDPDNWNDFYAKPWSRSFKMVREAGERRGYSDVLRYDIRTPGPPTVYDEEEELNPRFTDNVAVYWDLECKVRNR